MTRSLPPASAERIQADWDALAEFRDPARPGWTRRVFTEPYRASRDWICARMEAAGLDVRVDGAGNVVGEVAGTANGADGDGPPALVTGSHTDTVAGGGRFDGIAGVLGALEVVRLLRDTGTTLRHPLRVVDFLGEEANDFGLSCVGSRALTGELTADHLALRDDDGRTLADALGAHTGRDPSEALGTAWCPNEVAAFVELHIEQGRRLERAGAPIGVVSAIAGIHRCTATFTGRPDHAGTATMVDRRDALAAAAETVLAIERLAADGEGDAVGTTGRLAVEPGSINVVPGRAQLWAELRSTDDAWLEQSHEVVVEAARRAGERRAVDAEVTWTGTGRAVPTDDDVSRLIAEAADRLGYAIRTVPSGAGHDAAFMARLAPTGMVFVPSREGRSHCPEEWTDLDEVAAGAHVLAQTLVDLDAHLDAHG